MYLILANGRQYVARGMAEVLDLIEAKGLLCWELVQMVF